MPFEIVHGDITEMRTDAIVNAANSRLLAGSGVCGAIFRAAGAAQLQAECDAIGHCDTGKAVITNGYQLPAKNVIHTVGPIWRGGTEGKSGLLHDCYISSLALASEHGCGSVAFPLISAGIFGYPKEQAYRIAVDAIHEFLKTHEMQVYLVLFD